MRSFTLIIAEIQTITHLRKETQKYINYESKSFTKIIFAMDQEREKLEHELQKMLGIEIGDWETLYMYVKI
jgi:hypothetical protein